VNGTRSRPRHLIITTVIWLAVGSSPSLALDTINVSFPSPAPFYIPVAVAVHQGFFREQNLDLKLIVTRAEVDRVTPIREVIHFTKDGMLDDAELKPLVDDQLAGVNPKDPPLSQLFDFSLLQQLVKEGR
jgi:hypothetical protein